MLFLLFVILPYLPSTSQLCCPGGRSITDTTRALPTQLEVCDSLVEGGPGPSLHVLYSEVRGETVWKIGMLVARDTCKGRRVRRGSPKTPRSCGGNFPDRLRRSSSGRWLCGDELGNLQEGARTYRSHQKGANTFTRSYGLRRSAMRGTRPFQKWGERFTTNDLPGCPKGGPLLGTDKTDKLDGREGDDEIRGLGGSDSIFGGVGKDVIYGGPGDDLNLTGDDGDDVIYGGDGNDFIFENRGGGHNKIYCGNGKDKYVYAANKKNDFVSSSCEKKAKLKPPSPGGTASPSSETVFSGQVTASLSRVRR